MFSIGEFSKMAKISVKTVRYYDEVGLLKPARVDNWTNYRYYDTDQLMILQKIIVMKQAGLTIKDIQAILNGGDTLAMLQKTRTELAKRKELLTEDIARLDLLIKNKGEIDMKYQATIKTIPSYTVYYKQGIIKDLSELSKFILDSAEECREANPDIKCVKPDYGYDSFLDEEFKEKDIRVEYAQAVEKAGKETDTIKFKVIPETKAVCILHKGPYSELGKAYTFAVDYVRSNGYEMTEPPREVYINGCWSKSNEEDYLTEIQIPVK
jgi:DNA-binding transcriptional MerR regulator